MAKKTPLDGRRKSSARLAAVQALYTIEMTGESVDRVVVNFLAHHVGGQDNADLSPEETIVEPDGDLLQRLVFGASMRKDDLDVLVGTHLTGDWTVERLEAILRAILRLGAFELTHFDDVPPRVVISEYVDIAHAFYSGAEPGLANAVLDRLARASRSEEMAGRSKAP